MLRASYIMSKASEPHSLLHPGGGQHLEIFCEGRQEKQFTESKLLCGLTQGIVSEPDCVCIGRGSQSGVHEEQPATSGRVDATSSRGDAQAGGPLRDIFRGRKLQFWSRNTSRDSSQDGSKSTSGSPQPNSSRQQIKPNWVK